MRKKYRSAVYYLSDIQKEKSEQIIANLQLDFKDKIITKIIPFHQFKPSSKEFQNYCKSNQ